jgi:large subunit ribosomal protein L18
MKTKADKNAERQVRHVRLRRRVRGTDQRPRLCVYRSGRHIYAQVIDDGRGATLTAASSLDPDAKARIAGKRPLDQSKEIGLLLAERAKAQGVTSVVFDRGGYLYHGRVKALADGAREGGLEF